MKINGKAQLVVLSWRETHSLESDDGPMSSAVKEVARNAARSLANKIGKPVEIYAGAPTSYRIEQIRPDCAR